MPKAMKTVESLSEFLFSVPLYAAHRLPDDLKIVRQLYGLGGSHGIKFDGFCISCQKESVFSFQSAIITGSYSQEDLAKMIGIENVSLQCGRSDNHIYEYWLLKGGMTIEKLGQYPSLGDIAQGEFDQYRSAMSDEDASEFYKAIGLAAHGVGVGSFVYLRRVFERLIESRFHEFKKAEDWSDKEFTQLRMHEKVKFLNGYLPEFLVENAAIYSILSEGIHDLTEEQCLSAFDVMKQSIMFILQDDKQKQEELKRREDLRKTISGFRAKTDEKNGTDDTENIN
jgi:hypothetical protein